MSETRFAIVLAEDNPGDAFLVREALEKAGLNFDLAVIEDGADVLQHFEQARPAPDILLLDLNMPKYSGDEILQELRKKPGLETLPVVVLTSSAHPRDRELATSLGVQQYFTKPADYDEFMRIGEIVKLALTPGS